MKSSSERRYAHVELPKPRNAPSDRRPPPAKRAGRQGDLGKGAGRFHSRLVLDLRGARSLDDWLEIQAILVEGAVAAGAEDLDLRMRRHPTGGGVFGMIYMRQSRIRILTQPGCGLATIDLLIHNPLDPIRAVSAMCERFIPSEITLRILQCAKFHG